MNIPNLSANKQNSSHWKQKKEEQVANALALGGGFFVEKAQGACLWSTEGKRWIDFTSGIAVMNVGHSHPKVLSAVQHQIAKLQHCCFPVAPFPEYIQLAETLNNLAPGDFDKKTIFLNSGAEAVENAVKIARFYTKRRIVLAFSGAFHGRTHLTMALTGKNQPYKAGYGSFGGDVYRLPFPNPVHNVHLADTKRALEMLFKTDFDPDEVAAIIVEPVQGEGGYIPASLELMQFLREQATKHGILFIVDEVQSGFGRCGHYFAIDEFRQSDPAIVGDLYTYAKALAAGFPLSGVTGRAEIMDAPGLGGLGSTYGGNPAAISAAGAVIQILQEENLLQRSKELGKKLTDTLTAWQSKYKSIAEVRGIGSMVGMELIVDSCAQKGGELTKKIILKAVEKGLLMISCGLYGNTIRFIYPLVITDSEFAEALSILDQSMEEAGA